MGHFGTKLPPGGWKFQRRESASRMTPRLEAAPELAKADTNHDPRRSLSVGASSARRPTDTLVGAYGSRGLGSGAFHAYSTTGTTPRLVVVQRRERVARGTCRTESQRDAAAKPHTERVPQGRRPDRRQRVRAALHRPEEVVPATEGWRQARRRRARGSGSRVVVTRRRT